MENEIAQEVCGMIRGRRGCGKRIFCAFVFAAQIFGFSADAGTRKINVSIPTWGMPVIAFTMAKQKGYYREEGLEVELVLMSAGVATRALIGGDVHFATTGGAGLPPILSGAPLRFVFASFNRPMFWLCAKPEIREIKALKGKRVGVSNLGSGPDSLLLEILKREGLEGGRDVLTLALGLQGNIYAGLAGNFVDAAMLAPPFNFMAEEGGFRTLVSFIKEDLVELQGGILLRESLLQSDAVLVERFIRATLRGLLHARALRPGTVAVLTRNLRVKETLAEKVYDAVRPAMVRDGTFTEEQQRKALEHVLKRMDLAVSPPLERIFNFSLTRKVGVALEAEGWKPKP